MPEVWRVPPYAHGPKSDPFIYRDNEGMIAAAHRLGHVRGRVLDATWGYGLWWCRLDLMDQVSSIIAMDKLRHKVPKPGDYFFISGGVQADFRRPPFRLGSMETIFYDADYKLNGTSDKEVNGPDERYGADEEKGWEERMADLLDGVANFEPCSECGSPEEHCPYDCDTCGDVCSRCNGSEWGVWPKVHGLAPLLAPGGKLLVKCMDQVARYKIRWQTDEVTKRAEAAGLVKVDRLDLPGVPRAQPKGRNQRHARQNVSALLVFQRPVPPRRKKTA
jgi:hypothetical protein